MIPKIIHFCWFGPASKSEIAVRCMNSWKKHCPDFEFKEWNEVNSKAFQNKFYKDAYRKKQFAFVADCVRVQALKKYGGIYLDLDMLLLKPIDSLLSLEFFTGYEVAGRPAYGFFGGVAEHRFFVEMAKFYAHNRFNEFSLPVITHTFKKLITEENLMENERIFDTPYFYPLTYENRHDDFSKYITDETMAVHLWDHSWQKAMHETPRFWLKGLKTVWVDYLFYNYPFSYFKRYARGFSRKLYYRMIGKK